MQGDAHDPASAKRAAAEMPHLRHRCVKRAEGNDGSAWRTGMAVS